MSPNHVTILATKEPIERIAEPTLKLVIREALTMGVPGCIELLEGMGLRARHCLLRKRTIPACRLPVSPLRCCQGPLWSHTPVLLRSSVVQAP